MNDLSRGALVSDIVNTVAITAVQGKRSSSRSQRRRQPLAGRMTEAPVLVLNAGSSSLKYQLVVPETAKCKQRTHRADRRIG